MRIQRKWRRAWKRGKPSFMSSIVMGRKKKESSTRNKVLARKPRFISKFLPPAIAASLLLATMSSGFAAQIVTDGKTQTNLNINGNVTDITTSTINGKNALNSFSTFNVDAGNIVNMYVPDNALNLLNLVHSEQTTVNGLLNSIQNGQIGGNVYFLNPHGFVVGNGAVINVGALNVITPTQGFMDGFFDSPLTATNAVLSGTVPIDANGLISVQGKIYTNKDIKFSAGTIVNSGTIASGAVFSATKVDFSDVVNVINLQNGTRLAVENGNIEIVAAGNFENYGTVSTDGAKGLNAGNITINAGNDIKLMTGSVISAQGNGEQSSGGNIIAYAQHNAEFNQNATMDASGGTTGDGGFIELSAKDTVALAGGTFKVAAVAGQAGSVLIDPENIEIVNTNHFTGGGVYTLAANNSITVADGTIISTREIAGSNTLSNHLDDASTGNSGNISLTAPQITIGSGAQLLAHAINHGGSNWQGGDITLTATQSDHPALAAANAATKIDINGATLKGRNITLSATANAGYEWNGVGNIVTGVVGSLGSLMTGVEVQIAQSTAKSEIYIKNDSVLEASNKVALTADSTSKASTMTIPLNPGDAASVGIAYGETNSTATVDVQSGASIKAADLDISAKNAATLDINVYAISTGDSIEAAVAVSHADVHSTAQIAAGATIDVGNGVTVSAANTNSFSTNASAMALSGGNAGVAATVFTAETKAEATNNANLQTAGLQKVTIEALDNTIKNKTTSSATAGSSMVVRTLLSGGDKALGFIKDKLGSAPSLDAKSGATEKPKLAAAVTYAETNSEATATIGDNAIVKAADAIVVDAKVQDALLQNHAASSVESKSKSDDPANPTATISLSAAVGYGSYNHNADAHIGIGSQLTAQHVGIRSDVLLPYTITWDKWTGISTITSKLNGNLGLANGFLTGFANATGSASELGIAGSVSYLSFNNTSQAYAARNSQITILPSSTDSWSTILPSGSTLVWGTPVTIAANTEIAGVFGAGNISLTLNGAGGDAGAASVGGGYDQINYTDITKAYVAEGASIAQQTGQAAEKVTVSATSSEDFIAIGASAGRGASFGLNGMFSLAKVNNTTEASIDDEAQVTAQDLKVTAQDNIEGWSITGALNKTDSASVGLSVAINDVTTSTKSFIGDNDINNKTDINPTGSALTLTTGKVIANSASVDARTDGRIESISVAAAAATSSDPSEPPGKASSALASAKAGLTTLAAKIPLVGSKLASLGSNSEPASSEQSQPKFGLAISGSSSVNLVSLNTHAYTDGAVIQLTNTGATSLNVSAVNDTNITAGSGSASLVRANSPDSKFSAGVAGSVAVNVVENTSEAYLKDTDVTNAQDVNVTALAGGDQIAIAIGAAVNATSDQAKTASAAGSVSVSIATNTTSARIENSSTITGQATGTGRDVNVIAYDRLTMGTGGGSLIVGGKAGIGAAVTYSEISNTTEAVIADSTLSNYDTLNVHGLTATKMGAGGAMGGVTWAANSGTFGGAFVYSDIGNTVKAEISNSSVTTTGKTEVLAADTDGVATLNTVIDSKDGSTPYEASMNYNQDEAVGLTGDGSSIVSVAGVIQAGKSNVGLSFVYNKLHNNFTAAIHDSTISTGTGETLVNARSNALAVGAAVGVGVATDKFAGGGSMVLNEIDNTVKAEVTATTNKTLDASKLTIKAEDLSRSYSLAGQVSISMGNASVGGTVTYNDIGNEVTAKLQGITVTTTGETLLQADNDATIYTAAVAGGGSTQYALNGSVTVNKTNNTTSATSTDAEVNAGSLTVDAKDQSEINSLAGQITISTGKLALGVAGAYNEIGNTTNAALTNTKVTSGGLTKLEATNNSTINTLSASGGVSDGVTVGGSVSISTIGNTTTAGASSTSGKVIDTGSLEVTASDDSTIKSIAGQIGISAGNVAVGAAVSTTNVTNTASANLNGVDLDTDTTANIHATNTSDIQTLAASGGGSTQVAMNGSVTTNFIRNITEANVTGTGQTANVGSLDLKAEDTSSIQSLAGQVSVSTGNLALGAALAINDISNNAWTKLTGVNVSAPSGAVSLSALNDSTIKSLSASGGASSQVAINGSESTNIIKNNTTIEVTGTGRTIEADSLTVTAKDTSVIDSLSGAVSISTGNVAIGAAVAVNQIENKASAKLSGVGITTSGATTVQGFNESQIQTIAAAGGVSSQVTINGSVTTNTIHNTTEAVITGTGQNVNVGSLALQAEDTSTIKSLAGQISVSLGNVALGAALATNDIGNKTTADLSGVNVSAPAGAVSLTALNNSTIQSLSASGGGSSQVAINGAVSTNNISNETTATVSGTGRTLTANTLTVEAKDTSKIDSLSGAASVSTGVAALGGSVAYSNIANVTRATISDVAMNVSGLTNLHARNASTIQTLSAVGGFSAGFTLSASASAALITNTTEAAILSASASNINNVVNVSSEDASTISALSGSVSVALGSGAVGAATAVNRIGNTTSAHVTGSKDATTYSVKQLLVKSDSEEVIRSAAVGVGVDANVGVAGSIATNFVTSNNNSYIDAGTKVQAQNNVGVIAETDDKITIAAGAAGVGVGVAGIGAAVTVNSISGDTTAYISGAATEVTALAKDATQKLTISTGSLTSSVNLANGLDLAHYGRTDLKALRQTEQVTGVAVNASATHSIESIVANAGIGTFAGIAGTANVDLIDGTTTAYIDGAKINLPAVGTAGATQSVSVKASDHAYGNNFVGTIAAGAAGVGIGTDTSIFSRDTKAYIQNSSKVATANNITVKAQSSQGSSSLATSGSGGIVGVVGTGSIGIFESTTEAYLKDNTSVVTKNLDVTADHDSRFFIAAGGVTVGGVAAAGTFAVVNDHSTTMAHIDSSTINATGAVGVASDNSSEINSWSVSGAGGGGAGVAGSVVVSLVNNTSLAYVTGSHIGTSSSKADSVSITAKDDVTIANRAGSLGVGIAGWGVGASAGVIKVDDTTSAYLENSDVYTVKTTTVDAAATRNLSNIAVSVGVGQTAGISGTTAVTLVGSELSGDSNAELNKDNSGTLAKANALTTGNRLTNNQNVDVGTGITADELNAINTSGQTSVSAQLNPASLASQTTALVTGTSVIQAGGNINIKASEKDANSITTGGLAAGSVGVGGAVGIMKVNHNVQASVLNTAKVTSTGGKIDILAEVGKLTGASAAKVTSYQGSGGIVGLGAAWSDTAVTSNVTASAARGTLVSGYSGTSLHAKDTSDVDAEATGLSVGFAAAGIVRSNATKGGNISATVSDTAATGSATTFKTTTGTLSVLSERSGEVHAETLAGVGGVYAGDGSDATATENGSITALLGNQVTASGSFVQVEAAAEPQVSAEQRGYGGSLIAHVGIGFASATASPIVTASIGANSTISGGTLAVHAINRLNSGYNPSAYSYAEAVGIGGLLNANVNQSTAQSSSVVTANIGNNTKLTFSSATLSASNTTYEKAEVFGVSAGAIALGAFESDANANSTTTATMGNGVYGNVTNTLTVLADGKDTTLAEATAGGGGIVSGSAADASTHNGSTTTATLGGGTSSNPLNAGSMLLTSQHETNFNSKVDSINASLLGASGAVAHNYTYAPGSNANVGTTVTAQIAPNAYLVTQNIQGLAHNITIKDWLPNGAFNADAGSGGLLNGSASLSRSEVDDYTHFIIGSGAKIYVTGNRNNPKNTDFDAINSITLRDKTRLDAGGAIAIAKAESQLIADNVKADVTMGQNAVIDSVGPVNLGARSSANLETSANAKTYGLAGAAQGLSNSHLDTQNSVIINTGATIRADGDVSLLAGRDSNGTSNNLNTIARTDLFNKTAFPVVTDPQADAYTNQTNSINVMNNVTIGSVGNVNLLTDKGSSSASGQGVGKDLYREVLAEIGSAFSNLFGGGDVSLDIHAGTSINNASTKATVSGKVDAGIQHIQFLDISNNSSPNYSVNPVLTYETVDHRQIQVGTTDGDAAIMQDITLRHTPGVSYTIGTEDLQANLVTRITALENLLGSYEANSNTKTALQAEIDFLKAQLADMFPAGSEQSQVVSQVKDVPIITLNDVWAQSGDVNITADSLLGSGTVTAPGDVKISIINRTPAFIQTNGLTIPENMGGHVNFNGVSVTSQSGVNSRNSGTFTGTVNAANSSPTPIIEVLNTYVPTSSDAIAPDIQVGGDISNLRGTLTISSTAGSVNIQSADPTKPLSAPNIAAGTINISAGKDFVFSSPNAWYNVGGDPQSIWGGLRDKDGNVVTGITGSTTADNYENGAAASGSVVAARNGVGSAIAGNSVFISARYLNINGLVQSGYQDYTLNIAAANTASGINLTSEIQGYQTDYNTQVLSGHTPADPLYQLTNTTGNITAFYNAKTGQIEMQTVRSQGGKIQLVGEILNTGGGLIQAMDGYSKINVTNNSNYDIVSNGLDTGGDGIAGKVVITDFAKQYVTTVNGKAVSVPITTTYTRINGKVNITQTANVEQTNGSMSKVTINNNQTTSARGTDGSIIYAPASGERFLWVTGNSQTTTTTKYWYKTTGGWFFNWSTDSGTEDWKTVVPSGPPKLLPSGQFTPSSAQRTSFGSQSDAYTYTRQVVTDYHANWDTYNNWSSGFLGYYKHHERYNYDVLGTTTYNLHSVKGDYAIPVKFIGYDQGAVDVTSSVKGIVLAEGINNANGTTTLTANTTITSTSSNAVINSKNIKLIAKSGIGTGSNATPISFTLKNGSITATTTTGDINLKGVQGPVSINSIYTGSGDVTLSADGNIIQAAAGDSAVITGHKIDLTSNSGGIGTNTQSLNVQLVPDQTGDLTAGLNAKTQGDIYVRQPNNDFPLIHLESLGGSITVEAANGSLVNANPTEKPDIRNQEELVSLWQENQLLAGQGAETSAENTLQAYQNMIEQKYQTYWRDTRNLTVVQDNSAQGWHFAAQNTYDPNYLIPFSAAEIAQLKLVKNWNDNQVAAFQQQLTQDFGSGSYASNYAYNIPTAGSNQIIQSDLITGSAWTAEQLKPGITALYFKQTSDTQTVIPDPNITALHGNVTLKALNGSVGTDGTPVVITGNDLKQPTDTQRLALAAAEAIDIVVDETIPKVTVLQRRAINLDTTGTITIDAKDHVYIGSQTDLRIKTAKANESIRIKGKKGIYDVSTDGLGAVQGGSSTGSVILEAAANSIGTATSPFTLNLSAGTPLIARAGQDIHLKQLTGDLNISSIYTPAAVYVQAAGSILDVSEALSPVTIMGNGINLTADTGHIGTWDDPLKVAAGPHDDAKLHASAEGSGQGIYLESPSLVGSTAVPYLKIGSIIAAGQVSINTQNQIIEGIGDSIVALGLETHSFGGQTLNGANRVNTFNANNSYGGDIEFTNTATSLTITGIGQNTGNVNVNNTGDIIATGIVQTAGTGNVTLTATGTISETGSGAINNVATLTTNSTGGQTLDGGNTVQHFNATNHGTGDILLSNTANPLTIDGINQNTGNVRVNNTGDIIATGILQTAGTGNVTLNTTGTISETGSGAINNVATLTTNSTGGQTLDGSNTVQHFNATNHGTGDILLTNTANPLTLDGINQNTGNVRVNNTGDIIAAGILQTAGTGNVTLTAIGTISETGSGAVNNVATLTTNSTGGQTLDGGNTVQHFNATNHGTGDILLTNTANPLNITGIDQNTGNVRINNTGDIIATGILQTSGTGNVTLTSTGTIAETGSSAVNNVALLTTNSTGGQTLDGGNMVQQFNATNHGTGDILLTNTANPLNITGINQNTGNVRVNNNGAIVTTGAITTASDGNIQLNAIGGSETIGAAVTAGGAGTVTLTATGSASDVNINDIVSSTNGAIQVDTALGRDITIGGRITTIGDMNLLAHGSILNRRSDGLENLNGHNMNLTSLYGNIGETNKRLVVMSTGTLNALADLDIHIEAHVNLLSNSMVSQHGSIDLFVPEGGATLHQVTAPFGSVGIDAFAYLSIDNIDAAKLNFTIRKSGGELHVADATISQEVKAAADNIIFDHLVHNGSTPLQMALGGGSKPMADNVIMTLYSDVGVVVNPLISNFSHIDGHVDKLQFLNSIVGSRAEITNNYGSVVADNNPASFGHGAIFESSLQIYPELTPFSLTMQGDRKINTSAYVVNYDNDYVINEVATENSIVRLTQKMPPVVDLIPVNNTPGMPLGNAAGGSPLVSGASGGGVNFDNIVNVNSLEENSEQNDEEQNN